MLLCTHLLQRMIQDLNTVCGNIPNQVRNDGVWILPFSKKMPRGFWDYNFCSLKKRLNQGFKMSDSERALTRRICSQLTLFTIYVSSWTLCFFVRTCYKEWFRIWILYVMYIPNQSRNDGGWILINKESYMEEFSLFHFQRWIVLDEQ